MSIQVIPNFVHRDICAQALQEISYLPDNLWTHDHGHWDQTLSHGFKVGTRSVPVGTSVYRSVWQSLSQVRPTLAIDRCIMLYVRWLDGTGINPHTDHPHLFGATIYLTPYWLPEWGGQFCWRPDQGTQGDTRVYTLNPEQGMAVINHTNVLHWVTAVNSDQRQVRTTIQIWPRPQ